MTRVILSVKQLARIRTKWPHIVSPDMQGYSYYADNLDFKLVLNLLS